MANVTPVHNSVMMLAPFLVLLLLKFPRERGSRDNIEFANALTQSYFEDLLSFPGDIDWESQPLIYEDEIRQQRADLSAPDVIAWFEEHLPDMFSKEVLAYMRINSGQVPTNPLHNALCEYENWLRTVDPLDIVPHCPKGDGSCDSSWRLKNGKYTDWCGHCMYKVCARPLSTRVCYSHSAVSGPSGRHRPTAALSPTQAAGSIGGLNLPPLLQLGG